MRTSSSPGGSTALPPPPPTREAPCISPGLAITEARFPPSANSLVLSYLPNLPTPVRKIESLHGVGVNVPGEIVDLATTSGLFEKSGPFYDADVGDTPGR